MAERELRAFMAAHAVEVHADFVPFSRSRNAGEKSRSLNWRVTITRAGQRVHAFDYSAGVGHCPAYKASVKQLGNRDCIMRAEAIAFETEHGKTYRGALGQGAPILPDVCSVLASVALDASVIDARSFEEWAPDLGYDPDSRAAERIYRACLEIALALRAGLGEQGLSELRAAAEGY